MNETATLSDAISHLYGAAEHAPAGDVPQYEYLLAQRIASGDMQAFEEFYQRYRQRVYSLCLRMTGNVSESEDLTQEIFIHVHRKIGGFRGESTMTTWLHRVTTNKVLMYFRQNGRRREQMTEDGETPEPTDNFARPQGQPLILDRLALERAISKLSQGYRATLILHDVEGYEHAEIARMCGISIGTSKSQLHKARRRLIELLKGEG